MPPRRTKHEPPPLTADELANSARQMRMAQAMHSAPVRVSSTLSCGHSQRPSEPIPAIDAASLPGRVVICDVHDEWAVITRVTTRLVATPDVLRTLLLAADIDELTADYLAAEQSDDAHRNGTSQFAEQ